LTAWTAFSLLMPLNDALAALFPGLRGHRTCDKMLRWTCVRFLRMSLHTATPIPTTLLVCRYYETQVEEGLSLPLRSYSAPNYESTLDSRLSTLEHHLDIPRSCECSHAFTNEQTDPESGKRERQAALALTPQ
jgi:hypothetical protein